ncbi:hypothetical protein PPACK8108_LOCUS2556 [Phakopsora pachyrhizi]|uniref:Uncharacterized protein n=1 Tax=Phakopsora pachyrhizi TaxID=170000 RepID=A0AAV0AKU5_PHAPC|nr:hypothetical protein PPACK8108_LOCUS2556 [Phakopsora pachyrhizi]
MSQSNLRDGQHSVQTHGTETSQLINSSNGNQPSERPGSKQSGSMLKSIFDLENQFEFYGQYHSNLINILTHIVCVPAIFFSAIVLVHSSQIFPTADQNRLYGKSGTYFDFNLSTIVSICYGVFFTILEPISGGTLCLLLVSAGHWSNLIYENSEDQSFLIRVTWIVFGLSWILQFVGHGKFEKRAPALIDNLFQSLVLAVLFVWLEVWFYFGYRPELRNRLKLKIDRAILEYRSRKSSMKNKLDDSKINQAEANSNNRDGL